MTKDTRMLGTALSIVMDRLVRATARMGLDR